MRRWSYPYGDEPDADKRCEAGMQTLALFPIALAHEALQTANIRNIRSTTPNETRYNHLGISSADVLGGYDSMATQCWC
jgi:hypothetical protein